MHGLGIQSPGVDPKTGARVDLLEILGALLQIVEDGCEGPHDGWRSEAVSDHGEVSEVTLDGGVQERRRVGVAERRPVLVEKIHQLLADHSK